MKKNQKNCSFSIKSFLITVVLMTAYYYFLLPPMNLHSPEFWVFISLFLFIYGISASIFEGAALFDAKKTKTKTPAPMPRSFRIVLVIPAIILVIMLINFIASPVFNAKTYSKRITIDEGTDFAEEVAEVDFAKIPLLDKASTRKVGDRVMGELPELVSQFDVSNLYTQINYKDTIVRVTPLEYSDVIKYFTNRKDGIKAYIMVDSTTGKSSLVKLDKGMKYMPSAIFGEDLYRKLRFSYPFDIFGEISFEVDDEGNSYWIIPVKTYTAVGMREEISSLIIFNPADGTSVKHKVKDVPTWVDHVFTSELVLSQTNDWGSYRGGYFNSIFGQKNVVKTTEGYNYVVMNDDVYLYTGITSAVRDESNIGFILTNLRTKETRYYKVAGAEEFSAMSSAEGQVQQMKYRSTFPLLINLKGKPTYLISLKDNAGLVKMYAFVDVQNYQNVTVTSASEGIEQAATNYLSGRKDTVSPSENLVSKITVKQINSASNDGETSYYILDNENKKYKAPIKAGEAILPFLRSGEVIKITYFEGDKINTITKVEAND